VLAACGSSSSRAPPPLPLQVQLPAPNTTNLMFHVQFTKFTLFSFFFRVEILCLRHHHHEHHGHQPPHDSDSCLAAMCLVFSDFRRQIACSPKSSLNAKPLRSRSGFCSLMMCTLLLLIFPPAPYMSYSSSSSNSPSSSAVASWYCWYSDTRSFMLDSASVNSISSMPSPVYQ
jgi:hypothetical protein